MGQVAREFPDYLTLITECSGTGPDAPPNFGSNLDWDSDNLIVGGLDNGASGVQLFNLALNQNAGPRNGGNCSKCRGVVTISSSPTSSVCSSICYNVEYYVLMEAAQAFDNGAVRIGSSSPSSLYVVAALNSDGTTGIYINNPGKSVSFSVDDDGEGFQTSIPAQSVETFRWSN